MTSHPAFPYPLSKILHDCLKDLPHFVYHPNVGNTGDGLINIASYQIFEDLGLSYEIYDKDKTYEPGYTLVYGGGGSFVPDWGHLPEFVSLFSEPGIARCIILPQSMRKCPELLEVFDERFTIFLREKDSYDYAVAHNNRAQFHLINDMAFCININHIPTLAAQSRNLPTFFEYWYARGLRYLARRWGRAVSNKCNDLIFWYRFQWITRPQILKDVHSCLQQLPDKRNLMWLMRTDREKATNVAPGKSNYDLSLIAGSDWKSPAYTMLAVHTFLEAINQADVIVTDRLHVSIAAAALGKQVFMLDNNYGKLSGVWKLSMQQLPHIHFCHSDDELRAQLRHVTGE